MDHLWWETTLLITGVLMIPAIIVAFGIVWACQDEDERRDMRIGSGIVFVIALAVIALYVGMEHSITAALAYATIFLPVIMDALIVFAISYVHPRRMRRRRTHTQRMAPQRIATKHDTRSTDVPSLPEWEPAPIEQRPPVYASVYDEQGERYLQ